MNIELVRYNITPFDDVIISIRQNSIIIDVNHVQVDTIDINFDALEFTVSGEINFKDISINIYKNVYSLEIQELHIHNLRVCISKNKDVNFVKLKDIYLKHDLYLDIKSGLLNVFHILNSSFNYFKCRGSKVNMVEYLFSESEFNSIILADKNIHQIFDRITFHSSTVQSLSMMYIKKLVSYHTAIVQPIGFVSKLSVVASELQFKELHVNDYGEQVIDYFIRDMI